MWLTIPGPVAGARVATSALASANGSIEIDLAEQSVRLPHQADTDRAGI